METLLIAADENARQIPNLNLSEKIFKYEHFSKSDKSKALSLQEEILAVLIEDNMAPLYKLYCEKFKWEFDKNKYDAMM